MQQGWVCLHRSFMEHWLYESKPFCEAMAWVDLVLLANHESKKFVIEGEVISIERGQTFTSYRSLTSRWGWGAPKVKRYLELLKRDGMLEIKSFKNGTLLTLVNYEIYQDTRNANVTQTERKRNGSVTQTERDRNVNVTKQECKNEENDKNEKNVTNKKGSKEPVIYFPEDEVLNKALKDYIDYRKKARKPMTDRAIELMIKKINKYESATAVKMLEQSTIRGWSDIYPLNDKPKANEPQTIEERWANVH